MKLEFDYDQAFRARDTRFDGQFFVAVKTTGIDCGPVYPARPPLKKSCLFMETAAAERGDLSFRPTTPFEETVTALRQIRGIGTLHLRQILHDDAHSATL